MAGISKCATGVARWPGTHGLSKKPLKRNESLRARVEQDLSVIAQNPALVRSFFHAPSVAYVMD